MHQIEFKKIIKEREKLIVKGAWPLDHPLILAIKALTPDTDECIETDLTRRQLGQVNRRLRQVLPDGIRTTMRTRKYGDSCQNTRTRYFWLITKPEDRLNMTYLESLEVLDAMAK